MSPIRADASDDRGRVEDQLGPLAGQKSAYGVPLAQVEVRGAGREDRARPSERELREEGAAEEPASSRDQDAPTLPKPHTQ